MKRLLLVVLTSGWLSACTSVPEPPSQSNVDFNAVNAQQQQLAQVSQWRLRAQMALFDLRQDDRHGVYVDWFSRGEELSIRFSHPLRGTLARLEQRPGSAILIDEDGQEYRATSAEALLRDYFQVDLPINTINAVILGKQLPGMVNKQYQLQQNNGKNFALLADFTMIAADQLWRAELRQYQTVEGTYVPHSIDLSAAAWRLKLQVSEWTF